MFIKNRRREKAELRKALLKWLKQNQVVLLNATSLGGTAIVTSVLGFVYWWQAARHFPPADVGLASAAISTMTLLGTFCVFGLGTLLIGELPYQRGKEGALISAALVMVGGIGAAVGVLFAIIAPIVARNFAPLAASVQDLIIFAAGVSLTSISLVFDQALIGMLRSDLQLWRNSLFSVAKLVALVVVSVWVIRGSGMAIYATWALGNTVSLIVLSSVVVLKRKEALSSYLPQWGLLRKLRRTALQHHMLNLTLQAPTLLLPVVVTVMLSATVNAWFYVSWMLANLGILVPYILTTILYAADAAQPEMLASRARLTAGLAVVLCALISGVWIVDAKEVLGVFGSIYAAQAEWNLRILALVAFLRIVKDHYVAASRINRKLARAIPVMLVGGFLELVLATVGAYLGGLLGLSLGYVLALSLEAAYMSPTVYRLLAPGKKSDLPDETSSRPEKIVTSALRM